MKCKIKISMSCEPEDEEMYLNAFLDDLSSVDVVSSVEQRGYVIELDSTASNISEVKASLKQAFSSNFAAVRFVSIDQSS